MTLKELNERLRQEQMRYSTRIPELWSWLLPIWLGGLLMGIGIGTMLC